MIRGTAAPINCTLFIDNSSTPLPPEKGKEGSVKEGSGKEGFAGPGTSIHVSYSVSLLGPWSTPAPINYTNVDATSSIGCGYTNPSPHVLANGSVLFAFQGGPCNGGEVPGISYEMIGLAIAQRWDSPYAVLNKGQPIAKPGIECIAGFF